MRKFCAASLLTSILVCFTTSALSQESGKGVAAFALLQQPQAPEPAESAPLIPAREPSVLGVLDIITINSEVYQNIRNLRVWLPANYFAPVNRNKHYPVLYMQDGQNLFDEATAQFHEWKFDETVQFLTGSMRIHPMIVVGIDSTPRRANEYLPYPDADNKELGKYETQGVHGKQYGDFVIHEVMPLIEKKYRVLTGVHNTGLGGAGYGGAVAFYTVLTHPGVFGKVLIESPALLIGNGELLKDAEKANQFPEKMYLAIGTAEDAQKMWNRCRRWRRFCARRDSARRSCKWSSKKAPRQMRWRGRSVCRIHCCFCTGATYICSQ